jgi:hypothetical protein
MKINTEINIIDQFSTKNKYIIKKEEWGLEDVPF